MGRSFSIAAAVAACAVLAAGAFALSRDGQPPAEPADLAVSPTPTPVSHPLTRDAIAAREYPASPITVEQDLGQGGGFHSYVVSYRSEGHTLRALLNVPDGAQPPQGWPVVIFNHGYIPPDGYRTTGGDYSYWIEGLTRAGYIVIKPDYRGHDQSEGASTSGHYSPDYTYDVLTLVNSVGNWPGADPERIGMAGHSMGGAIALRVITATDQVKATASLAGVVGTGENVFYRWTRTPRPERSPDALAISRQEMAARYGEPRANPDFWSAISPVSHVQHVDGPVQVHHAADDGDVPKLFSDDLAAALRAAGKPVEYFEYPDGGHQFEGYGDVVLQRMIALFNAQLK